MPAALLDNQDLVTTVIRLKEFRPVEGTTGRIVISSEPGGSRVKYMLAATEECGLVFEILRPPSKAELDSIYQASIEVLNAAWDSPAASGCVPDRTAFSIGGLMIDCPGLGFDQ